MRRDERTRDERTRDERTRETKTKRVKEREINLELTFLILWQHIREREEYRDKNLIREKRTREKKIEEI